MLFTDIKLDSITSKMKKLLLLFILAFSQLRVTHQVFENSCAIRQYENEQTVCVCNSTFCDTLPEVEKVPDGYYQLFTTSQSNLGITTSTKPFQTFNSKIDTTIIIDKSKQFQKILGFGGAFTDSVGINLASLPEAAQNKLLEAYFSKDGSEYSICRVPIGGTDFSVRYYTYADNSTEDRNLDNFALQQEDYNYKIPYIIKASKIRNTYNKSLKLIGSAWTAPPWMKTNNDYPGIGFLKTEDYQLWADYHIRYLEEYELLNVSFWAITTGNEPSDGYFNLDMPSMAWTTWTMNQYIGENLGPTLRNSKFKDLKLIIHDDSRMFLPFIGAYLDNDVTLSYADGIAVHWYQDFIIPPSFLNFAYTPKKKLFLLKTEACSGSRMVDGGPPIDLGSWKRGENYVTNIMEDLQYNVSGWIDWNMALDTEGGPTFQSAGNDAPIIINATSGEFYKQPMYYLLAHFSKYFIPDSVRVDSGIDGHYLDTIAFMRPDNLTVVSIYNRNNMTMTVRLRDIAVTDFTVDAKSLYTLVY